MQSSTDGARREAVRAVPSVRVAGGGAPEGPAPAPGGDVGLSLPTYRAAGSFRLVGWVGGSSMSLSAVSLSKLPQVGGGKRGTCKGFSRASRLRMMQHIARLRVSSVVSGLFVTLTYPAAFPDAARAKEHLEAFLKRLRRAYPGASGLWRLEFQKRGAPHFHLVLFGVSFLPHSWVARAWYEVVGSGDRRHLQAGTEVRRVKSYQHAVHYVSKYLGKADDAGDDGLEAGRRWGHFGDWRAHLAEMVTFGLTRSQAARLVRVLDARRLARARLRVKGRGPAVRAARRRRALRFRQFWFGAPDEVLRRLFQVVGVDDG